MDLERRIRAESDFATQMKVHITKMGKLVRGQTIELMFWIFSVCLGVVIFILPFPLGEPLGFFALISASLSISVGSLLALTARSNRKHYISGREWSQQELRRMELRVAILTNELEEPLEGQE